MLVLNEMKALRSSISNLEVILDVREKTTNQPDPELNMDSSSSQLEPCASPQK